MLKNGAAVRFHAGTSETTALVYSMQGSRIEGGGECLVQLRTREPVVAGPGDRFILRALSPVRTLGGGMIVEAVGQRLKRNRPALLVDLQERATAVPDQRQFVEYCVRRAARRCGRCRGPGPADEGPPPSACGRPWPS